MKEQILNISESQRQIELTMKTRVYRCRKIGMVVIICNKRRQIVEEQGVVFVIFLLGSNDLQFFGHWQPFRLGNLHICISTEIRLTQPPHHSRTERIEIHRSIACRKKQHTVGGRCCIAANADTEIILGGSF